VRLIMSRSNSFGFGGGGGGAAAAASLSNVWNTPAYQSSSVQQPFNSEITRNLTREPR